MKKCLLAILGLLFIVSCAQEPVTFTVTFDSNGGSNVPSQTILKGNFVKMPTTPTKDDSVFFEGWYEDSQLSKKYNFSDPVIKDFTLYAKWIMPTDESVYFITYKNEKILLSETAYYLDATLTEEQRSPYNFTTIQEAASGIKNIGSSNTPITLYIAPNVYWTDDPDNPAIREKDDLVGLAFTQQYLVMRGMSGNPDDVIICSNRGNNAGANGNFNTMSIANGFNAYDITFANYCNVDLEYKRDSSKNRPKRSGGFTQAQTLITNGSNLDKLYFENCSFVSRLNLLSLYIHTRAYFKDCHFESTDDSLATGKITVYENCDFDLYSGTPCATSSDYLQSFLGCTFNLKWTNGGITLSKGLTNFAFIDCIFNGPLNKAEYKQNSVPLETRGILYNNKHVIDGNSQDLIFTATQPESSIILTDHNLQAFKIQNQYNVYNLLNTSGLSTWDPNNQASSMITSPWYVKVSNPKTSIQVNKDANASTSAIIYGGSSTESVTWELSPDTILSIKNQNTNQCTVTATSDSLTMPKIYPVNAITSNNLNAAMYVTVTPTIDGTASFVKSPSFSQVQDGNLTINYQVQNNNQEINQFNKDRTIINWFRASTPEGTDKVSVAKTTYIQEDAEPFSTYQLQPADIGYYIICELTPKLEYSNKGSTVTVSTETPILESQINPQNFKTISVDFEHFDFIRGIINENKQWSNEYKNYSWYGGQFAVPTTKGYLTKINQTASNAAWGYQFGTNGSLDYAGFITQSQGARLVYINNDKTQNMQLKLKVAVEKTAGQGFGSAGHFMDIYIKYDQETQTGYGLRIIRVAEQKDRFKEFANCISNSCYFSLMEYKNGEAISLATDEILTADAVSTAYNPICTIVLSYKDKILSADVTTTKDPSDKVPETMPNEVHLSYTFNSDINEFGGFGIQHTGTVSNGNRSNILELDCEYF